MGGGGLHDTCNARPSSSVHRCASNPSLSIAITLNVCTVCRESPRAETQCLFFWLRCRYGSARRIVSHRDTLSNLPVCFVGFCWFPSVRCVSPAASTVAAAVAWCHGGQRRPCAAPFRRLLYCWFVASHWSPLESKAPRLSPLLLLLISCRRACAPCVRARPDLLCLALP